MVIKLIQNRQRYFTFRKINNNIAVEKSAIATHPGAPAAIFQYPESFQKDLRPR